MNLESNPLESPFIVGVGANEDRTWTTNIQQARLYTLVPSPPALPPRDSSRAEEALSPVHGLHVLVARCRVGAMRPYLAYPRWHGATVGKGRGLKNDDEELKKKPVKARGDTERTKISGVRGN